MDVRSPVASLLLLCLLSLLSGCGKRGFQVQVCLGDEQNVAVFKDMMKSIARSQHMKYIDGSAATQKYLTVIKANPDYRLINIGLEGKDDLYMDATNLGLSAYEVSVGFAQGTNHAEVHRFADTVVSALKTKWHVYSVPPDRGAFPLAACRKTVAGSNPNN